MTTTAQHQTRVKSFSAAGDRAWYAHCDTCKRAVGHQTTDRETAQAAADSHAHAPIRGGVS